MKINFRHFIPAIAITLLLAEHAPAEPAARTFRLCEGITIYALNPQDRKFDIGLDVRDLNIFANGPREILFKVYDPDGKPVVREVLPDDGCTSPNFPDRIGGWDHELQYYANLHAKGTNPSFRWGAWSDPSRLATLVARHFERTIEPGKAGIYRIVLAGASDHYVTVTLPDDMKTGVSGHPNFLQGSGSGMKKSFIYVPQGTSGLFYAFAEPDEPQSRRFKLTAPDGNVLFDVAATGGYTAVDGAWSKAKVDFEKPGQYDGQLLMFEVSDGPNDFLARIDLQQPLAGVFKDYVGMGASAVYCPDEAAAKALQGGTVTVDGELFFHPFQVRFHEWMKKNAVALPEDIRPDVEKVFAGMRLLETSDGRGTRSWNNWAYGMGYYGFDVFRPSWVLANSGKLPADLQAIISEGLVMAADRLSFCAGMERVNGNAFSQINVALWYAQKATGDGMLKERFEEFWKRWSTEGWGPGAGLSKSGDSQEHFSHDAHYGSYLLDNWLPDKNQWVKGGGILGDAKDEPRFQQVADRYKELYTYLFCREAKGTPVPANPWSTRTHMSAHQGSKNWESEQFRWKGEPGPDLTASVNGGDEWFAARRKGYYMLTFHGRIAPEWMSQCFEGQLGFSGGTICQLTIPGRGPVLAGTLHDSYGKGMHPSQWKNLHVHTLAGETWDGRPLIAAISEHDNAKLDGNTVAGSGEIRDAHVRSSRSFTFLDDSIDCSVELATSDRARVLSIWAHERKWSEIKQAWEMIPFLDKQPDRKTRTEVTTAEGQALTADGATTSSVTIDRGGFGVVIELDKPRLVKLGENATVMIQAAEATEKPVPPEAVSLKYKLKPFSNPS